MLLLIGGIAALVFGIITVATGKLKLSNTKVVVGAPARVAGVILIVSFPLAFAIGVLVAMVVVMQAGGPVAPTRVPMWVEFVPLLVFILFVVIAFVVGFAYSQPLERARPRADRDYLQREEEAPEQVRPAPRPPDDRIRE